MIQPKKIFRTNDGRLGFEWNDGTRGTCPVRELRLACPCALCVDEHSGEKLLDESTVPADITLVKIQSIGRYAAGLTFSDGHNSGIYPYDKLRELTKKV
ncbi:DUF971 domain-containing protein [Fibrobacter sp. UBA4309]|uniref:DUF971 domain-containing protein n=1 Tax=Fibrobacter sp. UBA4309 TaxID=1946537 RepID=UPI0025C627F0|nr:DUF971 domain-containing protein [Fibrobacter sp. UBA4309]